MSDAFIGNISRAHVPDDDVRFIADSYRVVYGVSAQSDIAASDSCAKQVHVLLEGWACKYRLLNDGRRQIFGIHLPGEICDLSRMSGDDIGFGVLALTDCRVATIQLDTLRSMIEERPAARDYFMLLLAREGAALTEQVISLGRRSARERAAYFLCDLLQRLHMLNLALDNSFRLPLTQVDIGDYLGLSTVHVNRTLQDLKSERLIQSGGRTYRICNREALERLAQFQRSAAERARKVEGLHLVPSSRAFVDARM